MQNQMQNHGHTHAKHKQKIRKEERGCLEPKIEKPRTGG